jgi:hypothetical protein
LSAHTFVVTTKDPVAVKLGIAIKVKEALAAVNVVAAAATAKSFLLRIFLCA